MSRNKTTGKKKKLIAVGNKKPAPRWVDIKAFGLKRARSRRANSARKHRWRRDTLKV